MGLLLASTALAGCSAEAPEPGPSPSASPTQVVQPVLSRGWANVWSAPQPVLDAMGRLSLRPSAYTADGARYRSQTEPAIVLADPAGADANSFVMVAEGSEERLDTLQFVLRLTDEQTVAAAKTRFADQLVLALKQVGVPGGDAAAGAVAAEKPAEGVVDGARWTLTKDTLADTGRALTVTFTFPDATGAAR